MTANATARTVPLKSPASQPQRPLTRIRHWRGTLPIALGVFGFLASFIGSWIPSYWGDEAASVMSAERSLPSLFRMLGHVDAVHGTYYVFLHFWIGAFGASEISTRLPSAIGAGFVVAGTFLVGQRLARRSVGIAAALVCAVLPRVVYLGGETRSYAFSTAIAVWLTFLLLELVRRRSSSRWAWAGYAVGTAAGLYMFLYLGLLILVHGAYLISSRQFAPFRRRWIQAVALSTVLALPIAWFGYLERSQIAFLAHRNYVSALNILVLQWLGNGFLAVVAWAFVLLALTSAVVAWRRWRERSELIVLTTLWVVIPTVALLALSIVDPTYNLRYLSFSAPGLALLVVAGVFRLRARWLKAAALGTVIALAIPTDIGEREPYAMDHGSDLAQTAALVGAQAHPGDAIVFDESTRPSRRLRLMLHLYPSDFAGVSDVTLRKSYRKRDGLWDTIWPLDLVSERLNGVNTVWLVELAGSADYANGTDARTLEDLGYSEKSKQTVNRAIIYKYSEGT
ncbi:MAG TPA: glycosyltransferase family 39 protein [Galbitalea sp.]|jgi:mannosyltransferase|nr:glycosyltransferase family 39 protein [Galbitalea sp.]